MNFLTCTSNETRVCLTIANALYHEHALAEEKDSNRKRTVRYNVQHCELYNIEIQLKGFAKYSFDLQ